MANEKRLIDPDARIEQIKKAYCTDCDNYNGIRCRACWVDDAIGAFDDAPTVDAVPLEQYNELKERYKKLLETADILDTALGEYQRKYGE